MKTTAHFLFISEGSFFKYFCATRNGAMETNESVNKEWWRQWWQRHIICRQRHCFELIDNDNENDKTIYRCHCHTAWRGLSLFWMSSVPILMTKPVTKIWLCQRTLEFTWLITWTIKCLVERFLCRASRETFRIVLHLLPQSRINSSLTGLQHPNYRLCNLYFYYWKTQ